MSEPVDMTTVGIVAAIVSVLQWLFQWGFQRYVKRADQREEKQDDDLRESLVRIEAKLDEFHVGQRLHGAELATQGKQLENQKERIDKGLDDHRGKLENLIQRIVRLETKLEDDDG